MIKIIVEDTEEELKNQGADRCGELNCICGGGYGDKEEMAVHIDHHLNFPQLRLTTVHEILHLHFGGRVKHSKIDQASIDLIDGMLQIGAIMDYRQIPDNDVDGV
uniref:Uncharacterized protein n=1 Tax=viral metagenome TaxID=1070528 RepID=A0A6M3LUI6_9ZZZZ